MEVIRFIDCNHPGVVYIGTRAHMEGLAYEGGDPSELAPGGPYGDQDGEWHVRDAPEWWAASWRDWSRFVDGPRAKDRRDLTSY